MPELLWLSRTAWLYDRPSNSCVALAEALATVAHDRLTRLLQAECSGHTRLEVACRTRFVQHRGSLILGDTVMPKPCASAMEGLAWGFSSQERRPVYGFSLVRLVWTDGRRRIPLGLRLWHRGGPSPSALALEWRGDARHRRRGRPESGLFDAWYPSRRLLKRMRDSRWACVCRLKQNRRVNGHALRT